ncbi:hypothetical protein B0H14DRAFT_3871053 [Mycena olivaceomarginata]|nr:hypothetical protein B0H14DRAFT_3871053 [Mycena olivaceomarginata]
MSLPPSNYDPRRVCLNPFPDIDFGKHRRTVGVYAAVCLCKLAPSSTPASSPPTQRRPGASPTPPYQSMSHFVDWIPGICSLLGFLVINLIDKDRVRGEDSFGDSRAVWRARLFLFLGFALMAGGFAGSVTVLFKYYGYANVGQNVALMISVIVLWMAQNASSEYEYNLTL